MLTAPCKDCAERHPRCHSECEKYAEFNAERVEYREARKQGRAYVACRHTQIVKAARRKWGKRRK